MRLLLFIIISTTCFQAAFALALDGDFEGEWHATIVSSEGTYTQWYKPGDTSEVFISHDGILTTLDGGGSEIHFLLKADANGERDGISNIATADRPLKFLHAVEHVHMVLGDQFIAVKVTLPKHGSMTLILELPMGVS